MNSYGGNLTKARKLGMIIRSALTDISPKLNSRVHYLTEKKQILHLKHPKTLDEKLMWLKLYVYADDPIVKICADKYAVRHYLEEKGYGHLLNELLFAVDSVEEIPWETLPEQFALKWSFGSGYNIICSDKQTFNREKAVEKLNNWSRIPYWKLYSELQYKDTDKKIIGEKFLQDQSGGFPVDYKFYCFNGQPKCVMLCTERETGTPKFYFFDRDWNLLRLNRWGKLAPEGFTLEKPDCIDEMFAVAQALSEPFPFVRIDLYNHDGKTVFGEFTFAPSGGADPNRLPETDVFLGKWLRLK